MSRSVSHGGFRTAYDVHGGDDLPPVVLLHGWPGDRHDWDAVVPLLADRARLVVPDLRGFGDSDRHPLPPREAYSADAQLDSVLAALDDLGIGRAVWAGYDIGSRLLQRLVVRDPARVAALVLTPPLPGAGARLQSPEAQQEFWYQVLHRLPLPDDLLDGHEPAVRAYLTHFWSHWSGPDWSLPREELDRLVAAYARPGAFTASIAWYRSRAGSVASGATEQPPAERVAVPTEVLWPEHDPLFPAAWSDRLEEWFGDVRPRLLAGVGHFVPREAPEEVAAAVLRVLG